MSARRTPSSSTVVGAGRPHRASAPLGAPEQSNAHLGFSAPPEFVEAVAERAAELVAERLAVPDGSPWMTLPEAAEHIRAPKSRLYALVSKRAIPHEKDGSRLLFHRDALDAWVRSGGATRP